MDEEKKWMLMTYYCPTHGDPTVAASIEIIKKESNEVISKNDKTSKS